MDGYVSKPIHVAELMAAIADCQKFDKEMP
jgi:DNA-binding response OmpR family regulator